MLAIHYAQTTSKKVWEWKKKWNVNSKVRVATMTHDHDDTHNAILTQLAVPGGKWENL